ncbi:hypothetical protein GALMADRAFT_238130 [Galerina marginata CBS 339.88]|uniref:C2H2-type domain-containing protein n=1 Tax=Galerina marginata (strain CBS 339.88) TaxID=685588 RepID=A0A067THN5_GALM3|nr:hypothetical protein GALMADRAFT_238130 [Galerina marginata CBS 339.88]
MNSAIHFDGSYFGLDDFSVGQDYSSASTPDLSHSPSSSNITELSDFEYPHMPSDLDGHGSAYLATQDNEFGWVDFKQRLGLEINLAANDLSAQAQKDLVVVHHSVSPTSHGSHRVRGRCSSVSSSGSTFEPDAEGESESDSAGTDDEYTPFPDFSNHKRKRSRSSVIPPRAASPPIPSQHRPAKRLRNAPAPRNAPAGPNEQAEIARLRAQDTGKVVESKFKCPVVECPFHRQSHPWRAPDFKRHLKTHMPNKGCRCIGVRLSEAEGYSIAPDATIYLFQGEQYIGGCMNSFSRPDALKRHLDNHRISCVSSRSR